MKVIPLPFETQVRTGFTHKIIVSWLDLVAKAALGGVTNVTIQLYPDIGVASGGTGMPAGSYVRMAGFKLNTAFDFSDAGITSLLMEVGDGGSTARYIPQKELAVDGTEILYWVSSAATSTMPFAYLSADGIDAKFTCANGGSPTIDETTSGEVEIYLAIADMADLALVRQPGVN